MSKLNVFFWVSGCVAFLLTPFAQAELIINGSFEQPAVSPGNYGLWTTGSTDITGWTVVGPEVAIVHTTFEYGGLTFPSQSGDQWLDLTGATSNSMDNGVSQSVATTIGAKYLLSFHVGSVYNGLQFFSSTVDLSIDGGSRMSFTNPSATSTLVWQEFSYQFTAQNAMTNITFFNGSGPSNNNAGLDGVSLSAVPEPSSLFCVIVGAVGLAARRRRF